MPYEGRFGQQILAQESARGQSRRTKISLLLAIAVCSVLGAFMAVYLFIDIFTRTFSLEIEYMIGGAALAIGCFALAIFLIRSMIRYSKPMKAVLYARGLRHTIGTETTEIDFRDIEGIQDLLTMESTDLVTVQVRIFTIVKKNKTKFVLSQFDVPAHHAFFDALRVAFTDYLV